MKSVRLLVILFVAMAAHGDGDELFKQGMALFSSEPEKAFPLFEQAGGEGNVSAMVGAGHCLENGIGTQIDYAQAIEWYGKAVAQNNLKACEGLARIYASCPDPKLHDGALAVEYAEVLAKKKPKDAEALSLLAAAYARNVEFDKAIRAAKSAMMCAEDPDLRSDIKRVITRYDQMKPTPFDVTDDWMLKAADRGAHWAIDHVVWRYCDPTDPLYNPEKGEQLCKEGMEAECMKCWLQLAYSYLEQGKLEECLECLTDLHEYIRALPSDQGANKHFVEKFEARFRSRLSAKAEDSDRIYDGAEEYVTGFDYSGRVYNDHGDAIGSTLNHEPPNLSAAYFLFKIAAKKGNQDALKRLKEYDEQIYAFRKLLESQQGDDAGSVAGKLAELAEKLELGNELPKRPEMALWIYRQAYAMEPSPRVAIAIGRLLVQSGSPDEAVAPLERACLGGDLGAHSSLIEIYACSESPHLWNPEKALAYAKHLVENDRHRPTEALRLLACAYARNGNFMDACKIMEQLLDLDELKGDSGWLYQRQYKSFKSGEAWVSDGF